MNTETNFYELLNISRVASTEEIRRAYHEAALRMHPDVNTNLDANELFLEVKKAFETLTNPKIRKEYDQYLKNGSNQPILVDMLYSRECISSISKPQKVYCLVDFEAVERFKTRSAPTMNICLIIDRSNSMKGKRLETVKLAVLELLKRFKKADTLSIVVFGDRSEVLFPASQEKDEKRISALVKTIHVAGGTEIYRGLQTGYEEILKNFDGSKRSLINHMIILTDGQTYGDEQDCLALADEAARKNIHITSLGIGTKWNDQLLDEISSRSGGSSYYIARTQDIQKFIQQKFDLLMEIYAENVTLKLESAEDVEIISVIRLQPEPTIFQNPNVINLGTLLNSKQTTLLIEFLVTDIPHNRSRQELAKGTLDYLLASTSGNKRQKQISFSRLIGDNQHNEKTPDRIMQALSQVNIFKMQERARQEVREGKIEAASKRLQNIVTQLSEMGDVGAQDLANTILIEIDRIRISHQLSPEGEKGIKYGTRSLLLPPSSYKE